MADTPVRKYKLSYGDYGEAILTVDDSAPPELRCNLDFGDYGMFFSDEADALKAFIIEVVSRKVESEAEIEE